MDEKVRISRFLIPYYSILQGLSILSKFLFKFFPHFLGVNPCFCQGTIESDFSGMARAWRSGEATFRWRPLRICFEW